MQNYFSLRNVGTNSYEDYSLPQYLTSVLPGRDARILDIGCGMGQMLNALSDLGYSNLQGVDIDRGAIEHCKEHGLNVLLIEDIPSFLVSTGVVYDFIIMSHVLEHVDKEKIVSVATEIQKKLDDLGTFVVIVPNAQSNTGCYWRFEDFTHTTLFTSGSLLYVLQAAGFNDIRFLDQDGLASTRGPVRYLKKFLLYLYTWNRWFWNEVTSSSYHKSSPNIFTYEVKCLAKK